MDFWKKDCTDLNELGIILAKIPVAPKFAKMLIASHKYPGVLKYCLMIVACMTVNEIFTNNNEHITVDEA